MISFKYVFLLSFILGAMLASLFQMGYALDEADIERFSIWTFVATVLASLPSILW
ncbi:hypothetical protein [Calothrix sp. UHCC 0171]|uniref:hypothetical protein n=1 Tax=Calothrix sp. UHCC 0171 TaxID=3110245 RepID=UPI002B1EE289|nr:hypothetical protein [Calothrix sp. UHCC 0171]MEA5569671.1 hypothetical protein [Calothrix sp. UHCC 0171]